MTLIKVGGTLINADYITHIEPETLNSIEGVVDVIGCIIHFVGGAKLEHRDPAFLAAYQNWAAKKGFTAHVF